MLPSFSTPTQIFPGLGIRHTLPGHVRSLGGKRVALIGDEGLSRLGLLEQFEQLIAQTDDLEFVATGLSEVDPGLAHAESLAAEWGPLAIDVIVGVGGGSALSLAKAVALRLANPDPLKTYAPGIGLAPKAAVPTIAIPTTAGSGAEVSNAFVLYDTQSNGNVGIRGRGYEPNIALLDGELLTGLPETPMRDAALDAYSHAFEALWARGATRFSDAAAFEALRLIRTTLPRAMRERDPADLQTLLEASTLANFACGNAGLALVHALTGSSDVRIAHGRQNGVVLPIVAAFNRAGVRAEVAAEIDLIDELYAAIDAPRTFRADELFPEAADAMVAATLNHPFRRNNARETTDEDLRRLAAAATQTHDQA